MSYSDSDLKYRHMRVEQLEECVREAYRFLNTAQKAIQDITQHKNCYFKGGGELNDCYPEFVATKRASLDLARAMVKLRKPIGKKEGI